MTLSPTTFAITVFYQANARYHCSRRIRKRFDELARTYFSPTWMLGRYGGKARLRTEIEGIAVATRVEIGRVAFREESAGQLLASAFALLRQAHEQGLTSGILDRLFVRFPKADQRLAVREEIQRACATIFAGKPCIFLAHERDLLELGHCFVFQTVTQYMRQDGLYHSDHRATIGTVRRHLQQEVGRYENYRFFVKPKAVHGSVPYLTFYYTGAGPNRKIEIFMEEYTKVRPVFVSAENFQAAREEFIDLEDYERGSRRFGGLWVLQNDIVRYLEPSELNLLYLFFNHKLQPALDLNLNWGELVERQRASPHINRTSRESEVFLEMNLEGLVKHRFIIEDKGRYQLHSEFPSFKQVAFYQLGQFPKS
jgi:hypothetical protein